jgi:3-hydroxyisobutyrate dehydrogenase-like beta-hydroxyacid dehydrogenase
MKNKRVAFIGLGVMGYPMAGHLSAKGFDVFIYNRTKSKSEKWVNEFKGTVAETAVEAVKDADFICMCVGNDEDIEKIVYDEEGILKTIKTGAILIDHTTASAEIARKLSITAKEIGFEFLDAPISGGAEGAKNARLSIMVGGELDTFEKALPIMECYGISVNHMGVNGSGQLTKMVNQICLVANLRGVAEALCFGLNAGLDMNKVITVISKGAAQSWQLENRGPWMLNEKYRNGGFTVDLIFKDLNLIVDETLLYNSKLPVTEIIKSYFEQLKRGGKGNWDFSSIITLLK